MFAQFLTHFRQQYAGFLALFIALGGTSYAVATNSIGSAQIKNSSVQSKDIRNGQVSSADVRDRSLLAGDFKAGQLPVGSAGPQGIPGPGGVTGPAGAAGPQGPKGDTGAAGATGPPGAKGDTGAQGAPGVSGYERVMSATLANPAGAQSTNAVSCPAGKRVLGGGVVGGPGTAASIDQSVNSSIPLGATQWYAVVNNRSATASTFQVFAICGVVQ